MKAKTIKPKNCKDCQFNAKFTCVCLKSDSVGKHISFFGQTACKNFKAREK